jgi:hypothetical protein
MRANPFACTVAGGLAACSLVACGGSDRSTAASIAGESFHREPFPVTADLVVAAIRAADAAGRAYA